MINNRFLSITSQQVRSQLRVYAKLQNVCDLGIVYRKIGTHTIRTSSSMIMYLAVIEPCTIRLIGRWKSDAFLLYLREKFKNSRKELQMKWCLGMTYFLQYNLK